MDVRFYAITESPCLVVQVAASNARELQTTVTLSYRHFAGKCSPVWFTREDVVRFLGELRAFIPHHEGEATLTSADPPGGVALRIHPQGGARRSILQATLETKSLEVSQDNGPASASLCMDVVLAPSHWDELVDTLQRVLDCPEGRYSR
jgi:hypothetical protein